MTMTYGLLVFAIASILFGAGLFLEGIRRPRSRFAQQGWHIIGFVLVAPALLILVSSLRALQVQFETAAIRQRVGLPPSSPDLMPVWQTGCLILLASAGMICVSTELVLLLCQRLLPTRPIPQP